jgi:hypothetical protein
VGNSCLPQKSLWCRIVVSSKKGNMFRARAWQLTVRRTTLKPLLGICVLLSRFTELCLPLNQMAIYCSWVAWDTIIYEQMNMA